MTTFGVVFHVDSYGALSVMNTAGKTFLIGSLVLSLVIVMFITVNPPFHSILPHSNVFAVFHKGAMANGFSSVLHQNIFGNHVKLIKCFPDGIWRNVSSIFFIVT
jgi:hypothetical protein